MPFQSMQWFDSSRRTFADLPPAARLRKLIEAHVALTASYRRCYRAVAGLVARCRELPEKLSGPLSREQLITSATEVRDFVAQFYRFAIRAVEINANELAPDTYPTGPIPTESFDEEQWQIAIKEFLALLAAMAKYEDEFGTLNGFPEGPQAEREISGAGGTLSGVGF